jgi:hypothetical protein
MDVTNQLLLSGGWIVPVDGELRVETGLGAPRAVLPVTRGQRVSFPIDTRPVPPGTEPRGVFCTLEVDGAEVWRNRSWGAAVVRFALHPPPHMGAGFFGPGELPEE